MKIVLSTLNSKFIHSSLALRYLFSFSGGYKDCISILEFTINNHEDLILDGIVNANPDVLCFSCYIWNVRMTLDILSSVKKILPGVSIVLGGPEVSFDAYDVMNSYPFVDIVVVGEGEQTFVDILDFFVARSKNLYDIAGIVFRDSNGLLVKTPPRDCLSFDSIPFVYDFNEIDILRNRIIYYETQRGCPFSCQYCLSSGGNSVRFLSMKRVYSDLSFFLDNNVKQVKFVDRTFNCDKKRAFDIWYFLIQNDNSVTNFHFEISADLLDSDSLSMLKCARPGLFQFEIGVQSTNIKTLESIKRKSKFTAFSHCIKELKAMHNIHLHLDLIAGLPFEDYSSFGDSFDDVYALQPDKLQLGFLKLLKGTGLRADAAKFSIVHKDYPPYEVLSTNALNYGDILQLKTVEDIVEKYYNSRKALHTLKYIISFFKSPFIFYEELSIYWKKNNYHSVNHAKNKLYSILFDFCNVKLKDNIDIIRDFLKFDMLLCENLKSLPEEFSQQYSDELKLKIKHFYQKSDNYLNYLPHYKDLSSSQVNRMCNIACFCFDIFNWLKYPGEPINMTETLILFDYTSKDEIYRHANYCKIQL